MTPSPASALVLESVSKRFARGVGADAVSLDVDAGEVVGVWGRRRSGRSTLARLAACVERPDGGTVRVAGVDAWTQRCVRDRVALWHPAFPADHGRSLLRQVALAARRGRRRTREALADAGAALERVGLGDCGRLAPRELDHREIARGALARALLLRPRVLVLDEPLSGLEALEGARLLELIAGIARADRIAVLLTAAEVAQLDGADRRLSLSRGVLRGTVVPVPAPVAQLRGA